MNPLHSTLRLVILLLVLCCSMGAIGQTEDIIRSNDQPASLQSSIEEDSIASGEYVSKVYDVVEEPPSFPGGPTAIMSWISGNFHYPPRCESISGRIVVSFIVETDGTLSNIQIVKKLEAEMDKEFIRVVKAMPKWKPGKQNGQAVRVKYMIPLTICTQ